MVAPVHLVSLQRVRRHAHALALTWLRTTIPWMIGLLMLLTASIPLNSAQAVSFDCTKATTTVEKLICKNDTLSELDSNLATAYANALKRLDEADESLLRANQRVWLKARSEGCERAAAGMAQLQCVSTAYQKRIRELDGELSRVGPYIFVTVNRAWTETGTKHCSEKVNQSLSFPQIVGATSMAEHVWNSTVANRAETELQDWFLVDMTCNPDFTLDYTPVAASRGLIAVKETVTWMGASHKWDSISVDNQLVVRGSSLTEEEIFKRESGWKDVLSARVKAFIDESNPDLVVSPEDAVALSTNVSFWIVGRDDLTIIVDLAGMYGPANGRPELVIPWRDLKPYLRTDLTIALTLD